MDTTMDTTKQPADPTEVKHVAAIDDDEINLTLIEKVLAGFQVTSFDNPRRALEAFKEGATPDLIICDITMPGLDGFGLHGELRKIPALRSVPFIFLTALTDRDNVRRGMGQGADDYLTKPFTPDELRAAVRIRLQRTERLRHDAEQELIITSLGGLGLSTVKRRLQWEAKKVVELMLLLLDVGGSTTLPTRPRGVVVAGSGRKPHARAHQSPAQDPRGHRQRRCSPRQHRPRVRGALSLGRQDVRGDRPAGARGGKAIPRSKAPSGSTAAPSSRNSIHPGQSAAAPSWSRSPRPARGRRGAFPRGLVQERSQARLDAFLDI